MAASEKCGGMRLVPAMVRAWTSAVTVTNYIGELRSTIRRLYRCEASHTRTESVRQVVNQQVLWDGKVEVFALLGHDHALRCYAWGHLHEGGRWEVTTVLAIPPVVSAPTAVLAAVAAKIRERESDGVADQPRQIE